MKEYFILYRKTIDEIEIEVEKYLEKGFLLAGGICAEIQIDKSCWYLQAVYKLK